MSFFQSLLQKTRLTRWAPHLIFLVLSGITFLVWREQVEHRRALIGHHTKDICVQASRRLEIQVESNLTTAATLGRFWVEHEPGEPSQQQFEEVARLLLERVPGCLSVHWVDAEQSPKWHQFSRPESMWEKTGGQAQLVQQALRDGQIMLSAPVPQGPEAANFFAVVPLQRGSRLAGALVLEFAAEALMNRGLHSPLRSEFSFWVVDEQQTLYRHVPEPLDDVGKGRDLAAAHVFSVQNRDWELTISPRKNTVVSSGWLASISIAALGTVLSVGLSCLVYLLSRRMDMYRSARDQAVKEVIERRKAQEALRASESRYRSVFNSATNGLLVLDEESRIVEANPAACSMHGCAPGELQGKDIRALAAAGFDYNPEQLQSLSISSAPVCMDLKHQRVDGSSIDVEVRASRFNFGEEPRVLAIVTDVSERNQALQRLALLSRDVLQAQEEERARVSRELHDELGQLLTASRLELGCVQRRFAPQEDAKGKAALGAAIELVEKAADELRHICKGLRPPLLDDLGLEPAVRLLTQEFEDRAGTQLVLNIDMDETQNVPKELALCVYRIVQESLNNVSRHSGAQRVEISLVHRESELMLSVIDNGQGFDTGKLSHGQGCGIAGMRERANLVNGTVEIRSTPTQGTQVLFRVALGPSLRERMSHDSYLGCG